MAQSHPHQQFQAATCQIISRLSAGTFNGTGFHYGNGSIITNSHVLNGDGSNLEDLEVRFSNGQTIQPSRGTSVLRVGFVIHVPQEIDSNYPPDFALFKDINPTSPLQAPGIVDRLLAYNPITGQPDQDNVVQENQSVYCLHYGRAPIDQPLPLPQVAQERVESINGLFFTRISRNANINTLTTFGSSGSPIFNDKDKIVGIHFAGDAPINTQNDNDHAYGLRFYPTVTDILQHLVRFLGMEPLMRLANNQNGLNQATLEGLQREVQNSFRILESIAHQHFPQWKVTFFFPGQQPLVVEPRN